MVRRIYNHENKVIYHSINEEKNQKALCEFLWNKYVKGDSIKVRKNVNDGYAYIKFYFLNGITEEFTEIPTAWGSLTLPFTK